MRSEGTDAMGEENGEKSALVPRRRFPEFREAGAWEKKNLDDCLDYQQPTEYLVSDTNYSNAYETPVLTAGKTFVLGYTNEKHGIFSEGLPVIIFDDFTTATQFVDFPFKAKSSAMKILQAKNRANIKFMYEVMQMISYQVGVHERHWISRFSPMQISAPCPKEQQKIADCLSSLDELITAETHALATLKTHKKGLMQQLFPREGETVPRLRFPEFREAGEWEEKLIEDFFEVGSSKRVLQEDWTTQGVPFYRTRELVSLSKNEPFGSEIFISEELFREISEKYGLPADGDFLVSGVGTLGISYQVQAQDRFYFKDGNVLWFKLKGGIVSTFFKYCFDAEEIQNQILGQASVSTVGTYTIQNAKVTKFSCPANIEEQQEIADCLSSLDDLITAQSQKIATLKTHKKGLMQQLFPSSEEIE